MLLIKSAGAYSIRYKSLNNNCKISKFEYFLFIVLYCVFATFRKVDNDIGGADALNYIEIFENIKKNGITDFVRGDFKELVFYYYQYILHCISDNYKIFFAVTYGIIAYSYIYCIKNYIKEEISYIPFILLIFPYLKSFCTLRTSFAIALFLFGVVQLRKNKILSAIFFIASIFVHRMSIVFTFIWFFYYIMKELISDMKGLRLGIFLSVSIFLSVIAARGIQYYFLNNRILYATDNWYLKQSVNRAIFDFWPMYFAQLILLLTLLLFEKQDRLSESYEEIRLFCIFDFILCPACLILGLWRANEYLYVFRLLLWGYLISAIGKKFEKRSRIIYKIVVFFVFLSWLVFRIWSEWDSLKIMPYIFDFN